MRLDAVSNVDNGATTNQAMMYQWTNAFPLAEEQTQPTVCQETGGNNATTYCANELYPKTFTEHYN